MYEHIHTVITDQTLNQSFEQLVSKKVPIEEKNIKNNREVFII
jgi:hypothetical protein